MYSQGEGSIGIFVDRIHENGSAYIDGRLKPGDQIAEIDGQTLIGKSHVACMNILRGTGKSVSITVIRKSLPGAKGVSYYYVFVGKASVSYACDGSCIRKSQL